MPERVASIDPNTAAPVMIIDDDIDLVDEMVEIVRREHKMSTIAAHSSAGAIRCLEALGDDSDVPRVVFLDLHMEDDFSGFRVLRHLRRDIRFRRTPIVMISYSDDSQHVEQAYKFGATSFINKPYDVRALHEVLTTVTEYWCELNIKATPFHLQLHDEDEPRRVVRTTESGDPVEYARLPNMLGYMRAAKLSVSKLARLSVVPHLTVTKASRGESVRTRDIHKLLRVIVPRLSGTVDLSNEIVPGTAD